MKRQLIWVDKNEPLPDVAHALTREEGANGLLAAGIDLSAERLIEAYTRGIFPWFSSGEPVLWWSPNPRMVLRLADFKISKSFRKTIRAALRSPQLDVCCDTDFAAVMNACAAPRTHQAGTWIHTPMVQAYVDLHRRGLAHSIEVRIDNELVGGLYCVAIGHMVFGESMFSRQPNSSKIALACLVSWLLTHGGKVIDCQQQTEHLASLGGAEIDRTEFEAQVSTLTKQDSLPWKTCPPCKHDLARWAISGEAPCPT